MKILHCISTLDFRSGGPVRAVIDLSEALAARGHEVTVLVRNAPDAPEAWSQPGSNVRVIELGRPQIAGSWYRGEPIRTIARAVSEAEAVHLHSIWVPQTAQIAKVARRLGKPYVVSIRGMLDDWCMEQRRLKKLVYLRFAGGSAMLNGAAFVHCTADGELSQSAKWFPGSTGVVIPNLLDLSPYENPPGPELARARFPQLDRPEPTILYLSRLHYKKGVEHLIDAARILRDRGNPHHVIIAGKGDDAYERALRERVTASGLDDLVAFPGMVVGDEKVSLYQAADVFVLPTSQENFGFVFFEALAAGCPVITTRGVDTWPELEQAGALIVQQQAGAMADAIGSVTADRPDARRRGAEGRAWVFRNLDPANIVRAFEALYHREAPVATHGRARPTTEEGVAR